MYFDLNTYLENESTHYLGGLSSLVDLLQLNLSFESNILISDVSFLDKYSSLTKLTGLNLRFYYCEVTDISPLAFIGGLVNLLNLDVVFS